MTDPRAPAGVRIVLEDGATFDALGVHYIGVKDAVDHWHAVFPAHVIDELIEGRAHLHVDVLPAKTSLGLADS